MSEQTQTFTVYRDGEPDPEYQPSAVDNALEAVRGAVGHVTGAIALQARMATFDVLHGTNYRQIRNQLAEQKKREEFERSIGLVAIK